ncbi:hypothetical protein [Nocardia sp. NPDC058666]|uniref:hypothetical protein n=1 Tax=unclassified Nocardia TaxID=2637762 RepID=UPI003661AF40
MSWVTRGTSCTNPDYYRDAADHTEARLRADFAMYYQLRQVAPQAETPSRTVELTANAYDIARRWEHGASNEHRQLWQQLDAAVQSWNSNPESARVSFGRLQRSITAGEANLDSNHVRTLYQAAELTGHTEPVTTDSTQDGARWRPRHLSVVPDLGPTSPRSGSAADRALGGRSAELLPTDKIDALIAATDELLDAQERAGDLDTGADELTALIPASQRTAPITHDYSTDFAHHKAQIAALRRFQDLTAEHLRLAGEFDGTTEGGQSLIARMETLIDAARHARDHAVALGIPGEEITAAYHAGLEGTWWSQQPGAPRLGQLDQVITARDTALAEIQAMRTVLGADQAPVSGLAVAAGAETTYSPADPAGAVISGAVDAALPELDLDAQWATPAITGVIDAPRHQPAVDPQF